MYTAQYERFSISEVQTAFGFDCDTGLFRFGTFLDETTGKSYRASESTAVAATQVRIKLDDGSWFNFGGLGKRVSFSKSNLNSFGLTSTWYAGYANQPMIDGDLKSTSSELYSRPGRYAHVYYCTVTSDGSYFKAGSWTTYRATYGI